MKQYNLVNNLLGWFAFAIAAFTYCMTVEPTASFWDCPEFITTAFKLEVGHPPGAPFFMLTGNFFTLFTDDPTKVALCVNIMSALLSAFCILFLFWTITHLTRKLVCADGVAPTLAQTVLIMGAGLTGALAYTWSDTFWYSAVEGEVYAYSSFLTALTFWLILKWENHADEPHSDRWLVLIFYITGLSIGVHLLNLLCLPAIALVYYFKKNPQAQLKGSLCALAVSALLVVAVLYGVVPGIVKVGGEFEWFFVNTLGMSFNTGLVVYILLLIAVVLAAVWSTTQKNRNRIILLYTLSVALLGIPFIGHGMAAFGLGLVLLAALVIALLWKKDGEYILRKRFLNTSLLCMLMLMIGYSSYAVIVVRSTQNTPMDQNSPEDIFTLGSYLNREQYGNRPLLMGEAYTSQPSYVYTGDWQNDVIRSTQVRRVTKVSPDEPDRYEELEQVTNYVYPSAQTMFFPRMYSARADHRQAYNNWLGIDDENPNTDGIFADFKRVEYQLNVPDGSGYTYTETIPGLMPTQWTNLKFFTSYQVNFMYWRYFLWNFAGRQNDIQGHGQLEHGNCITGIPLIDDTFLGDQDKLPDSLKNNKGRNVFYCLPLLLGLIGLFWQCFRGQRGVQQFWVVFFLFFMTGLAIVVYLNQTPMQPRERDYAYAGSFYAFAIWIGIGVAALYDYLNRFKENMKLQVPAVTLTAFVSLICLLVPIQMVSQTWDDHDRSGRYACRDFGQNYLATLPAGSGAIIYTNGDNDTFPLWYAQEVEGVATDARVCNLSYLNTDWYIDQMKRPQYDSPGLPIDWERYEYVDKANNNSYRIVNRKAQLNQLKLQNPSVDPYELTYLIDNYVRKEGILPTDSVVVNVNREAILRSGMTLPMGDSIPEKMSITFKGKNHFEKSEMMIYEMLARNNWERPIYMSVTLGESHYRYLKDYLALEGLAYRITPFKTGMRIDVDKMYDNMMNRFRFGNVNAEDIYLDETVSRMCQTHRHMLTLLARHLMDRGDKERALNVMQKCKAELPMENIPYEDSDIEIVNLWSELGQTEEAERVAQYLAREASQYLDWLSSLGYDSLKRKGPRFVRDCMKRVQLISELSHSSQNEDFQKELEATLQRAGATEAIRVVSDHYMDLATHNYNYFVSLMTRGLQSKQDYEDLSYIIENLMDVEGVLELCHSSRLEEIRTINKNVQSQLERLTQQASAPQAQPGAVAQTPTLDLAGGVNTLIK